MKKGTFAIKNKLHVTRYALRIMLITLMALFSLCQASNAANVFLNSYPSDITINEGDPLSIPIFFDAGSLIGQPVELFVWAEIPSAKAYLANDGTWHTFSNYSELQPALQLSSMIQYANVTWVPLQDSHGLPSFTINICLDGNVDGHLNEGVNTAGAACGTKNINVIPIPCTGVYISPASISASASSGKTATSSLSIKNSCNNPIDFTAQTSDSWIGMSKETGVLNITLNSTGLSTGAHTGSISISSGDITKTVSVSFTVTSDSGSGSSCPFPVFCSGSGSGGGGSGGGGSGGGGSGGGTTCTPSSLSVSPGSVSFTGTAGGTVTPQTVYVTNNCGGTITFTATKATGSWLTVGTPSGNTFTVSANTAGMSSGSFTGSVTISASGYASVTYYVYLTITGQCVANNAVPNPSSISQTVNVGGTLSPVSVSVKDNCGTLLAYTIPGQEGNFFTVTPTTVPTTANFTVNFTLSTSTPSTNSGNITVHPANGYSNVTFPVAVNVVTASQPDNATVLNNGAHTNQNVTFTLQANSSTLFKFIDNETSANNNPAQVSLDCMNQNVGCASNVVVKYAGPNCENGPATMDDYNLVVNYVNAGNGSSMWNSSTHTYSPPRARYDLYYNIMRQGSNELIGIYGDNPSVAYYPDQPHGCYYAIVYNPQSHVNYLIIGWSDFDAP